MKSLSCPNRHCPPSGKGNVGAIIRHGFYPTRSGKHRRYQCRTCGKTFCSTTATPYYRLQHRRATFDEVTSLSVEGLNKSAIARVKRVAWITVHRWLVSSVQPSQSKGTLGGGASGRRDPNDRWEQGTGNLGFRCDRRLVSALVIALIGKRSYRNTLDLFRDLSNRMNLEVTPLITTDEFKFYQRVIGRVFGSAVSSTVR